MNSSPKTSVVQIILAFLLPITAFAACGADWCSFCYDVAGTDCSGGDCYCYCLEGGAIVINDGGDCSETTTSEGAIAGIVIGVLSVLGIFIGVGVWLCCKVCKSREAPTTDPNQVSAAPAMTAKSKIKRSSKIKGSNSFPPPSTSHVSAQDHTEATVSTSWCCSMLPF